MNMKQNRHLALCILTTLLFLFVGRQNNVAQETTLQSPFHQFVATTLEGDKFPFSQLKGKKVMIVNTASQCGLTGQLSLLEELYQKYKERGFTIIAFPANNFKNQEPLNNSEIRQFCQQNYGVSFPIMDKISVAGDSIHPIYQWLTSQKLNHTVEAPIKWNFQKFLITPQGQIHAVIPPQEKPNSPTVIQWIEQE